MNDPTIQKCGVILVGAGSMGKNHLRLLKASPQVELLAVVDPAPSVPVDVPLYADLHSCLATHQPQAAVIATPLSTHFDLAKTLLQLGVHVLLEKPISPDLQTARELSDIARQKELVLAVGHSERYNPAFLRFLDLFQQGITGEVYRVDCQRVGPFPQRIGDTGVTMDLSVHDLDVLHAVLGTDPEWIVARKEQRIHEHSEDGIQAWMGFPGEVSAMLTVNWLSPRKERFLNVYGHKGMLYCDFFRKEVSFFENCYKREKPDDFGLEGIESGHEQKFEVQDIEPLFTEHQTFFDWVKRRQDGVALREVENCLTSLESAIWSVHMASEILQRADGDVPKEWKYQ